MRGHNRTVDLAVAWLAAAFVAVTAGAQPVPAAVDQDVEVHTDQVLRHLPPAAHASYVQASTTVADLRAALGQGTFVDRVTGALAAGGVAVPAGVEPPTAGVAERHAVADLPPDVREPVAGLLAAVHAAIDLLGRLPADQVHAAIAALHHGPVLTLDAGGRSVTLSGVNARRLLSVTSGAHLTLRNLQGEAFHGGIVAEYFSQLFSFNRCNRHTRPKGESLPFPLPAGNSFPAR